MLDHPLQCKMLAVEGEEAPWIRRAEQGDYNSDTVTVTVTVTVESMQ